MTASLNQLTATETVELISTSRASCREVAEAALARIEARDDEVRAWAHIDPELVMARAARLDDAEEKGPLHGVPFGAKDIIDTVDEPTAYGTPIHHGRQAGRDAACIALSRRAGGLLVGKTITTEFANVSPGETRNPHDLGRTPGGSSSGSAAAVADDMVPLALGTQTTGSTTRPASFCGIFGYRPTYGDLRMSGVMEAAGSFDTLGILARSIDDVALYRQVLLGVTPQPLKEEPSPRIGFCRPYFWDRLPAETQTLMGAVADRLANAGAEIEEVVLPDRLAQVESAHRWIAGFEMARNLTWEIENRFEMISERLREGRIKDGLATTYERYVEMRQLLVELRSEAAPVLGQFDLLIAPAAAREAPPGWDPVPDPWIHMIWTALHVPSLTIPVLSGPQGLPLGVQLIAGWHRDSQLLSNSQWVLEALTPAYKAV